MEHMRRSLDPFADVTSAIEARHVEDRGGPAQLKEYESAYGVNPTYLAFVAKATVEMMRDYPWMTPRSGREAT